MTRKEIDEEIVRRLNEYHWLVENTLKGGRKFHLNQLKMTLLHCKHEVFRMNGIQYDYDNGE